MSAYYDISVMIAEFYERDLCNVGGPLHIVLDDLNVEDQFIHWCISDARALDPEYGVARYGLRTFADALRIADALLRIPEDDREDVIVEAHTIMRLNEMERRL